MDRIIEVKVNGNHVSKDNKNAGVQHEGNVTNMRITFDPGWDGYAKKITWWDALGKNPVERTLTTNLLENILGSTRVYMVPIPPEPLAEAGWCTFVIDGYSDGKRQRSVSDQLQVKEAPFEENAGEPTDPTPSQAEQLQKQIDAIMDDIQDAAQAADAKEAAQKSAKEAAESAKVATDKANDAATSAKDALDSANEAVGAKNEAVKAQKAIENMGVEAESLPAGSEATVEKSQKNGSVNLKFGIPKGEDGRDAAIVDLENGIFAMQVSDDGHLLVMVNDGQTPPNMYIDPGTGHLHYVIK